jgi:hypothetical protein
MTRRYIREAAAPIGLAVSHTAEACVTFPSAQSRCFHVHSISARTVHSAALATLSPFNLRIVPCELATHKQQKSCKGLQEGVPCRSVGKTGFDDFEYRLKVKDRMLLSSGLWRRAVWFVVTNVLKKHLGILVSG